MVFRKKLNPLVYGFMALSIVALLIFIGSRFSKDTSPIHYAISPYQDTAMPVIAESMGLYKKNDLNVELKTVAWEEIVPSLASAGKTIDVGIGSINTLLPRVENINVAGGGDVVFAFPFYVFKGAALLMQKKTFTPLPEFIKKYPNDLDAAVKATMAQLKGKKVGVPQGTPYEQMLLAALKTAGMDPKKDIDLRYVKLADALPAFLSGNLDIIGAGVTQRTEAMRSGHTVFLDMESLGFAEIVGLVTTQSYAEKHKDELNKLIRIWFESVNSLLSNVDKNSKPVLDYLSKNASTKYSLDEYKTALKFQEFPRSLQQADNLLFKPSGKFYWKRTWNIVNDYLVTTGKVKAPISYNFFKGDEKIKEIMATPQKDISQPEGAKKQQPQPAFGQ